MKIGSKQRIRSFSRIQIKCTERLRFQRNFAVQSFNFRLSYPYVSNAFPLFRTLLKSIPHVLLNRLNERVLANIVFKVTSAVSVTSYLKGLNSKFPLAIDFLLICMEVVRLIRETKFLIPFRSDFIKQGSWVQVKAIIKSDIISFYKFIGGSKYP